MPIGSAINEIQRAVFERLSNDAVLAELGVRVHAETPTNEVFPYVMMGDITETGLPTTHSSIGRQVTITLHIWSEQLAADEVASIGSQVIALFERESLALADGWTWEATYFEMNEIMRDPGGRHRHGVQRMRVRARRAIPVSSQAT